MANITLSAGSKQVLATGIVMLLVGETLSIELEDGGEEQSLEIIIQNPAPTERKPPQLSIISVSETSGRLTFLNTTEPFGIGYQVPLGTINKKKLTDGVPFAAIAERFGYRVTLRTHHASPEGASRVC